MKSTFKFFKFLVVILLALAFASFTTPARGQTNFAGLSLVEVQSQLTAWLAANNPAASNLYDPSELDFRVGGVFSQSTGEGGILLDVTKCGIGLTNVGIGATIIEGNVNRNSDGQNIPTRGFMAGYVHADYRKVIGNVAAKGFLGVGYDNVNNTPMGIVGVDIEYRIKRNLGTFIGLGYALEKSASTRGLITGAGVTYSF